MQYGEWIALAGLLLGFAGAMWAVIVKGFNQKARVDALEVRIINQDKAIYEQRQHSDNSHLELQKQMTEYKTHFMSTTEAILLELKNFNKQMYEMTHELGILKGMLERQNRQ